MGGGGTILSAVRPPWSSDTEAFGSTLKMAPPTFHSLPPFHLALRPERPYALS